MGSCVSDGLQTLQVEIYMACNIGGRFASCLVKFNSPFLGGRVEISSIVFGSSMKSRGFLG